MDTADNYGQSEALIGQFVRLHPEHAQRLKVLTKLSFMLPAAEMEAGAMSKELLEYVSVGSWGLGCRGVPSCACWPSSAV